MKETWKIIVLIVAILLFGVTSWLTRYEIVSVPAGGQGNAGTAYRLDRWTGEMVWVYGVSAKKVQITNSDTTTP